MTIARVRAVKTKLWGLMFFLFLCGCNEESSRIYRIQGATTDFCVPRGIDVTPRRINDGNVIKGGFTLNGCWRSEKNNCIGPDNVISLVVSDRGSFAGNKYSDLPLDAYLSSNARANRKYAELVGNNAVTIPDASNIQRWYLWSVRDVNRKEMSADDQVETICTLNTEVGGFQCDRKLLMPDYLLGILLP
jgi:hypothetical protein